MCLVALAGCVTTYRIDIDGSTLHRRSKDLRYTGKAKVDATLVVDDAVLSGEKPWVEHVTMDQTVTDRAGKQRWIRDLLRGCDDNDPSATANVDCALDQPLAYYSTRSWQTRSTSRFLQYTLGATITGALLGAVVCAGMCPEDTTIHDVSKGTAIVLGVSLVGIIVWGILDCAGKWGEPGCRD